jgi:hypothetical protein
VSYSSACILQLDSSADSLGQRLHAAHLAAIQSFVTSSCRMPSRRGGDQPTSRSVLLTSRRHFFRLRGIIDATGTQPQLICDGEGSANADAYRSLTTAAGASLLGHFSPPSLSASGNLRRNYAQVSGKDLRNIP